MVKAAISAVSFSALFLAVALPHMTVAQTQARLALTTNRPTLADTPAYCTTAPQGHRYPPSDITPPIPCAAAYEVQKGLCCHIVTLGDTLTGPVTLSGPQTCTGTGVSFQIPLAPCVSVNPWWNGCPGNMMSGTCCNGPGLFVGNPFTGTMTTYGVHCVEGVAFVVETTSGRTITSSATTPLTKSTSGAVTSSTVVGVAVQTAIGDVVKMAIVGAAGMLITVW